MYNITDIEHPNAEKVLVEKKNYCDSNFPSSSNKIDILIIKITIIITILIIKIK